MTARRSSLPVDRSTTRPLVGRERELTEILACLDRAAEGRGSLVMVMGAPGIGKSRLVDEVASVAMTRGTPVLWGRCWDTAGAPPYWPWVQAMRAYLRSPSPVSVRAQLGPVQRTLPRCCPSWVRWFPDLAPPPATDPESARFQLFDSITTFLLNASRGRRAGRGHRRPACRRPGLDPAAAVRRQAGARGSARGHRDLSRRRADAGPPACRLPCRTWRANRRRCSSSCLD